MPYSQPVQSQEHRPMAASYEEHPELLACVMAEVIFTDGLHELVALGVSRQTEPRKVKGMEIGMESGEEEQNKQRMRARVTARWE